MKKILLACLPLAFGASLQAKLDLVSVDSIVLVEKSKAGQEFIEKMRKEKESLDSFTMNSNKELAKLQEEISLKAQVLSKDALQEKMEQFEQKRRESERKVADKRELASMAMQREQMKMRDKQMAVIKKVCEREGWDALLEKNNTLFVANSIDKTPMVLKELDAAYDAEKSAATKTVKKVAEPLKREIKVT
jgi:outer membrane protein